MPHLERVSNEDLTELYCFYNSVVRPHFSFVFFLSSFAVTFVFSFAAKVVISAALFNDEPFD